MKRLALLLLLSACTSAGGMLRVQSQLWREGGVAHLARTQPMPGTAAWTDWRNALEVAASTVCTEDQRQKLTNTAACRCADGGLDASACGDFLAGRP